MNKAIMFIFLIGVILCPDVLADHISLTNGDRLTGQVIKNRAGIGGRQSVGGDR